MNVRLIKGLLFIALSSDTLENILELEDVYIIGTTLKQDFIKNIVAPCVTVNEFDSRSGK